MMSEICLCYGKKLIEIINKRSAVVCQMNTADKRLSIDYTVENLWNSLKLCIAEHAVYISVKIFHYNVHGGGDCITLDYDEDKCTLPTICHIIIYIVARQLGKLIKCTWILFG